MPESYLIKNATCVLPHATHTMSVLLADGKIHLDPPATATADHTIDATGLHLLPGVIDDQVHFRDPGLTHKEDLHTGSRACAAGGVTTFLEMPNTKPTTTSCEALHAKLDLAAGKSIVNYGFYIGATPDNVEELKKAKRTPGIKIFIGSSTGNLLVDEQEALERIFAETKLPICAHCEDETTVRANAAQLDGGKTHRDHSKIRNHEAAVIATRRSMDLAIRHQHHFHVLHVSTAAECQLLQAYYASLEHINDSVVSAEVCPHHLLFNVEDYDRLGSLVQMNPSIKDATDNARLWAALNEGTIQVIATDHAPHTLEEKQQPYPQSPSGLPAVENSLALMLNAVNEGRTSLERVVDAMTAAPAKIWNIANKGQLSDGFDADVVLVDMNKKRTVRNAEQQTKSGWSPWDGVELTGWPVKTWCNGNLVFDGERVDVDHRGQEVQFNRED
ncbi:dihydroorotase [Rubinisphaera sp. JC750]|uniref:dihydroorotase n=1 Tax=Rubinisphaera sp. JC750 TaxID=2898658 RepID=UPI001F306DB7|nr:dihydroorotase [Rubinisphaera sp. JC750]